jgi:hypothetical protein
MSNRFADFFRRERKLPRWLRFLETLTQQREPSPVMQAIESSIQVIMTVGVGLVIALWLFVVIIGPMLPASKASLSKSDAAANLTAVALWNALPGHTARVDRRFGDNLNLYVQRKVFEDIPYPDRDDVVQNIGRTWCENIEYPWLPRVSIFDIRTGKRLTTHVCAVSKLREVFSKSSSRSSRKQNSPTDNSPAQGAKTNALAPEQLISIAPDLTIAKPVFGILTADAAGGKHFLSSTSVPLVVGQSYGWMIRLDTKRRSVKWREELQLPKPAQTWGLPSGKGHLLSLDGKTAITQEESATDRGFIGHFWGVAPHDPSGSYTMNIFVEDRLVAQFAFRLEERKGEPNSGPGK